MSDTLLESLYPETIYQITPKPTVVINVPWEKVGEAERVLLAKILGAVKLSLESVRIVVQSNLDLTSWIEKPERIICFSPASGALSKFEVIQVDSTSLVLCNSLSELLPDDAAKRKLWLALKQLFSI